MHYENKLLRIESSCKFVRQFPKRQAFIKKKMERKLTKIILFKKSCANERLNITFLTLKDYGQ